MEPYTHTELGGPEKTCDTDMGIATHAYARECYAIHVPLVKFLRFPSYKTSITLLINMLERIYSHSNTNIQK